MGHWLMHFFGLDNGSGPHYLFWSGSGSDLTELAIIGGAFALIRKHNCNVKRCWRIGRFRVEGSPYTVCRKHHPGVDGVPEAGDIKRIFDRVKKLGDDDRWIG